MKNLWVSAVITLWTIPVWASCITLDKSNWTLAQISQTQAVAYELTQAAGKTEIPAVNGSQLCASTFDITAVITQSAMEAKYASDKLTQDASLQAQQQEYQSAKTELQTNNICGGNISDLDAKIDALTNAVIDLPTAKSALNLALKKIARCMRANTEVGR